MHFSARVAVQGIGCKKYLAINKPTACAGTAITLQAYPDTKPDFRTGANININLHRPQPSLAPSAPFPEGPAGMEVAVVADATIVVLVNPTPAVAGVPGACLLLGGLAWLLLLGMGSRQRLASPASPSLLPRCPAPLSSTRVNFC